MRLAAEQKEKMLRLHKADCLSCNALQYLHKGFPGRRIMGRHLKVDQQVLSSLNNAYKLLQSQGLLFHENPFEIAPVKELSLTSASSSLRSLLVFWSNFDDLMNI